jgi:hypothetical protein
VISIFLFSIFLYSCEDLGKENIKLRKENKELELQNFNLSRKNRSLVAQNACLDRSLHEKRIYLDGEKPKYLITLKVKQSFSTLEHTFEITLETSRECYNRVKIGEKFKTGSSFWINGDIEHLEILVKDKKIVS